MPKRTTLQLEKYNINQMILKELSDLESRAILFSIVTHLKLPLQIAHDSKIPQSTVYKKLHRLESLGLIYVEKIELINHVKSKHYRSMIREAEISIKNFEPIIRLISNKT